MPCCPGAGGTAAGRVGVWLLLPHASPATSALFRAVATAVKLAEDLSGEENIAFAFCDHAVDNYDGFRLLAQEMPTAATVLLLDNLTSGPAVALAHGEYRKEAAEQLCSLLPEDKSMTGTTRRNSGSGICWRSFPEG